MPFAQPSAVFPEVFYFYFRIRQKIDVMGSVNEFTQLLANCSILTQLFANSF